MPFPSGSSVVTRRTFTAGTNGVAAVRVRAGEKRMAGMHCVVARRRRDGGCALARFGYIAASGMVDMRATKGAAGM